MASQDEPAELFPGKYVLVASSVLKSQLSYKTDWCRRKRTVSEVVRRLFKIKAIHVRKRSSRCRYYVGGEEFYSILRGA